MPLTFQPYAVSTDRNRGAKFAAIGRQSLHSFEGCEERAYSPDISDEERGKKAAIFILFDYTCAFGAPFVFLMPEFLLLRSSGFPMFLGPGFEHKVCRANSWWIR